MTAREGVITGLLAQVQAAGTSYLDGSPSAKGSLLDTIKALQQEIESPAEHLSRTRFSPIFGMCQLMAIEMGLLDAIVKQHGQSIDASALAKQIQRDEGLIARIMRLLTANGVCDETGVRQYRSNAMAELLVTPGQVGATRNMMGLIYPISGKLVPLLRETAGLESSPASLPSPFEYTHGKPLFDYLNEDAEQKEAFDSWMASRHAGINREWFEIYPLKSQLFAGSEQDNESVFLVSVAGGNGRDISSLRTRFPDLPGRLVVQDLPQTFENIPPLVDVEMIPQDMFTEQPIKGARAYFLRGVLHDWSDSHCQTILTHTAHAMKPGYSRLLIDDIVLPDQGASVKHSAMDMIMYLMPGGIERTLEAWEELLASAGLRILKVWKDESTAEPVIEAVLKGDGGGLSCGDVG